MLLLTAYGPVSGFPRSVCLPLCVEGYVLVFEDSYCPSSSSSSIFIHPSISASASPVQQSNHFIFTSIVISKYRQQLFLHDSRRFYWLHASVATHLLTCCVFFSLPFDYPYVVVIWALPLPSAGAALVVCVFLIIDEM